MYNCDRCRNKDICKYEEASRHFEDDLNGWVNGNCDPGKPECVDILVRCNKFSLDYKAKKE